MVNTQTPTPCDMFVVDLGGHEVDQFAKVDLPDMSTPVVEHNSGSSEKRYPTKHAEQPDYGGEFTMTIYARGEKNTIDQWWEKLKTWEAGANATSISVAAKRASDQSTIARWEFEEAMLTKREFEGSFSGGDATKMRITVKYRKMKREIPGR